MPSIHAEIPGRTGGLGSGMDLVIQLTAKAVGDVVGVLLDRNMIARGLERLATLDPRFYHDNNLEQYTASVDALSVSLGSGPPRAMVGVPITLETPGGDRFRGIAEITVPLETDTSGSDPRAFFACRAVERSDVELAYRGPRSQAVLDELADRHANGLVLGLRLTGNIDFAPTNSQFHASGLHAAQHELDVFEAADTLRSVVSLRTAFSDHQDFTLQHLKQIIEDHGPVMASGGLIREDAGVVISRFELLMEPSVTLRREAARVLVDLTGTVQTEQGEHRLTISVPLAVQNGQLVVDLPAASAIDMQVAPNSGEVKDRVLASLHARAAFPIDLHPHVLVGLCGVVADKQPYVRLFMQTTSLSVAADVNHIAPGDEIVLAVDRRLAAGFAWDSLAATNPQIHRQQKLLMQRWQTGFSADGITVDAQVKLEFWADPARVLGHIALDLQIPAGGGTCKALILKPELTGYPPVTMMVFGPLIAGFVGAAIVPVLGIVLGLLASVLVAMSPLLIKELTGGAMGDQGDGIGNVLNTEFHGFRPCVSRLDVQPGGFVLGGKLVRVTGTSSHPLQVVGRQTEGRRTTGYILSTGDVLSIPELVVLMEAGLAVEGVHLVHGKTGTWVRSDPDEEGINNLANLPTMG